MPMSDNKRKFVYEKNTLVEVICQLRFPTILSIETSQPAEFQDAIREEFPRYVVNTERIPSPQGVTEVKNHAFISADGRYKINISQNFVSISTMTYTDWQSFAEKLDEPLSHFISIYKPAFFERVGIRYMNAVSRKKLGCEHLPWRELIAEPYLGPLALSATDEAKVRKCGLDFETNIEGGGIARIHAGPGMLRRALMKDGKVQMIQENETKFMLDIDVFVAGQTPLQKTVETLDKIHLRANEIFGDAITDTLHEAMEPVYKE